MSIPYFNGLSWNDLTREERFYCFALYSCARENPADFAVWLNQKAGLNLQLQSDWDLGLEVCFYRDYRWHQGESVRRSTFSPKRTFDLCLFGQEDIVIIEAKVDQPFASEQNATFSKDSNQIKELLSPIKVNVWLVALASSKYFDSGWSREPFHGHFSWADAHQRFGDKYLLQADQLYGSELRKLRGLTT